MSIQYRAVLYDPGKPTPDRPIQILTNSLHDVNSWIVEVIGGGTQLQGPAKIQVSDQAEVLVYVSEEKLIFTYDVKQARQMKERKLHRSQQEQVGEL